MLVHNCPISTDLSWFLVATHEAQENVLLYFIHAVKYVENWGIVFLVNALMFHKVSRGFNKHQWPTKCTTFLRAVGYLILNIDICSLLVRIDCAAMKPEWWLFFLSWMKNTFFCTQFSPQNEGTRGAALLLFFDYISFFGMPSRRLCRGKRCR